MQLENIRSFKLTSNPNVILVDGKLYELADVEKNDWSDTVEMVWVRYSDQSRMPLENS